MARGKIFSAGIGFGMGIGRCGSGIGGNVSGVISSEEDWLKDARVLKVLLRCCCILYFGDDCLDSS